MIDVLVLIRKPWWEDLTEAEVLSRDEKTKNFAKRHARRMKQGDIIEVRPGGYYKKHGFDEKAFAVVSVPGDFSEKVKNDLMRPVTNVDGDILQARNYKCDLSFEREKEVVVDGVPDAQLKNKVTDARVTDLSVL
jgi:hypothetical protein